jgi:hypothetical protein
LFFARRVAQGISVEHDAAWASHVDEALAKARITSWQVERIPPSPGVLRRDVEDPAAYFSSDANFGEVNFERYARAIDAYPDHSFDLVIVDGRARPSCFFHAVPKVAPGGYLLLDQSERPHYRRALERGAAEGWQRSDFPGPAPYLHGFTMTTIWRAPTR